MSPPSLSPLQALEALRRQDPIVHEDGFRYILDGPCMCPVEMMAPFADSIDDTEHYYPDGEECQEITEKNVWLRMEDW